MLQRIQTLYLLLAIVALSLLFFFPLAELAINNGTFYIFKFNGLFEQTASGEVMSIATIVITVILGVNILLSILAIIAFKMRDIQIRMCVFNILLLICLLGVMYFYVAVPFAKFQAIVHYKVFVAMPLVAIILNYMAIRAIRKDDNLIKSIDRIR